MLYIHQILVVSNKSPGTGKRRRAPSIAGLVEAGTELPQSWTKRRQPLMLMMASVMGMRDDTPIRQTSRISRPAGVKDMGPGQGRFQPMGKGHG
jgi:hypothetical protein